MGAQQCMRARRSWLLIPLSIATASLAIFSMDSRSTQLAVHAIASLAIGSPMAYVITLWDALYLSYRVISLSASFAIHTIIFKLHHRIPAFVPPATT